MLHLLLAFAQAAPIHTPYADRSPLAIRSVAPAKIAIACFEPLEVAVDLTATFDNPFDPEDISLDAVVDPNSKDAYVVPGYWSRPYRRTLNGGREEMVASGPGGWRLRLAALRPGKHIVLVEARDRSGTATKSFSFTATSARTPGYVQISKRDPRYFETTNGRSFFPIGENLCWGVQPGTSDYDRWIPALGKAKANYGRLWLSPAWVTFGLEAPGRPEDGKGMGQFDMTNAARLDYVLQLAEQNQVRLLLTIDSFNILRDKDGYPYWDQSPHNAANGGPLRNMVDFWTDPTMAKLYRNKLRYLVARYGAFPSVFAWEFWNEVDVIRDFKPDLIAPWHTEMARALKGLDPYHHPVTTSLGETAGNEKIDLAPGIDYVQTHHYSSPDLAGVVAFQQARKTAWHRAHMVGEIAADVSGDPHAKQDRRGYQVHDPMWASVATGCAGSAQPWFWDSLVEPNNLYPLFTAMANFVAGVDFPAEGFSSRSPSFAFANPADRGRDDLTILGQQSVWRDDPLFRPQVRTIQGAKFIGGPISEMQHGTVNHGDWHNPVTFQVNLDRPTKLEVDVSRVSGHGGALLQVQIDGRLALDRDFVDKDKDKTDDLNEYVGAYAVTIPAGKHAVKVENTGTDWFAASYRFVGVAASQHPPIDAWGVAGKKTVLGWARVSGRTWPRVVVSQNAPETAPRSIMSLGKIVPGSYRLELWNTWTGEVFRRSSLVVGKDQMARIELPVIHEDLAFKLIRTG